MKRLREVVAGRGTVLALCGVVVLHVLLVLYFAPPGTVLGGEPVATYDYSLHAYQAERAVEAFRGWGELWSYDPFALAGQPAGAVEDLTSKGLELFVIGAVNLGASFATAYNVFMVLVHLALPLAVYWSARCFDLGRGASAMAVFFAVLMWFFDSFLHWCWFVGMISWAAASYLTLLVVALTYRALRSRRMAHFVLLWVAAALLSLVHPFGVVTVALPCLALYVRRFPELSWREHALLWLGAGLAGATALVWLRPALAFRHYIGEAGVFLRPTLEFVLLDSLDLWKDVLNTGEPVRTMIRTVCFAAAFAALLRWRRHRDDRVLPLTLFVVVGLAFAYLGGYSWTVRQTQPYRQLGPAMLGASLPAAALLVDVLSPERLRAITRPAKALLLACLVLIVPRLVRTIMIFVPETVPSAPPAAAPSDLMQVINDVNENVPPKKGYSGPPEEFLRVRDWLVANHAGRGRVFVSHWVLGEYLAGFSGLPILGGLPERNVPHVDAHLFRARFGGDPKGLEKYLQRYAVGFVVLVGPFDALDGRRDLFEPAQAFGDFRIYRTKTAPSYFQRGQGRVEQSLNSLRVFGASGDEVILRFHWMETLRCRPGCEVERAVVAGDRVGFVAVRSPPRSFEIYNSYEL